MLNSELTNLMLLLNGVCLEEKQQKPFCTRFDPSEAQSNTRFIALEANTISVSTPPSLYIFGRTSLSIVLKEITWKNKEYHIVRTIPQSNTKIIERGKIDITNTYILNRLLSWLRTSTSIDSGGVQVGFHFFSE